MTNFRRLVTELCPQGVPYEPLSALGQWFGGGTPSKARADFWEGGSIPWLSPKDMGPTVLSQTKDYITPAAVANSSTKVVPPTSVVMVVRSSILRRLLPTALVPVPVALNQDMRALVTREDVLPGYVFQVLRSHAEDILSATRKTGGSVNSLDTKRLMNYRIPVPPLPVQREIVRTLELFASLSNELQAELELRQTQYSFYRDRVFTFSPDGPVPMVPMTILGKFFGGLTGKTKADFTEGNARFASYMNVFSNPAVDLVRNDFVRVDSGERQNALKLGDVLFTGSSETEHEVAMSSVVTDNPVEQTYLNSFSIGFRPNDDSDLVPAYAKHLFRSTTMRNQLLRTARGVTRYNVSKARLGKVLVPLPSAEEQARLAAVLDRFERLLLNRNVGIPAEIAFRREQYVHYRDGLLRFDEVMA